MGIMRPDGVPAPHLLLAPKGDQAGVQPGTWLGWLKLCQKLFHVVVAAAETATGCCREWGR